MKEKFMKNGVFSLEYDKETLKDMVLELQEKNQKQKEVINKAMEFLYKIKFDKTDKYICISEYIEYQQLLDILNEVSE